MAYDPSTVIERYQQLLDIPGDEPLESLCGLTSESKSQDGAVGCPAGGCQGCCVGVVEVVRQYSERLAELEVQSLELGDTQTKAEQLERR